MDGLVLVDSSALGGATIVKVFVGMSSESVVEKMSDVLGKSASFGSPDTYVYPR